MLVSKSKIVMGKSIFVKSMVALERLKKNYFEPTLEKFVVPSMKILLYVLPSGLVRFYNYLSKVLRLTVGIEMLRR